MIKSTKKVESSINLENYILLTVHKDQLLGDSKKQNIIIAGLKIKPDQPDVKTITNLCQSNLGFTPNITFPKRLEKLQAGKVQLLRATCSREDNAHAVFQNASLLRRSDDVYIRKYV